MVEYRSIPLKGKVPSSKSIEFLRAEICETYRLPLARVLYIYGGQESGIRLDLDKKVFIDHMDDEQDEEFIQGVAPVIARVLAMEVDKKGNVRLP